jgi:hypothetical protein
VGQLALSPTRPTAGQGTAARYTVAVTNIDNVADTYTLVVTGLPAGIQASFAPATITVPPGRSSFRTVALVSARASRTRIG